MNINPKAKTARVELRLTPQQKEYLQTLAANSNTTVTNYIITHLSLPLDD